MKEIDIYLPENPHPIKTWDEIHREERARRVAEFRKVRIRKRNWVLTKIEIGFLAACTTMIAIWGYPLFDGDITPIIVVTIIDLLAIFGKPKMFVLD